MSDARHTAALRRLHAVGKRLGLTHEDLRAAVGVASLAAASADELRAAANRLEFERPRKAAPRRPRLQPGTIRPATDRQRTYLAALLAQTGWGLQRSHGWLFRHYQIRSVGEDPYTSTTAHRIISALQEVVRKAQTRTEAPHAHVADPVDRTDVPF